MHDPSTVAFEIKYPWRNKPTKWNPKGYRDTFITIWHDDPEKDGTDDSCGFTFPNVPQSEDWFGCFKSDIKSTYKGYDDLSAEVRKHKDQEGVVMWLVLWLQRASFLHRGKPISPNDINQIIYEQSFPGNRSDYWAHFRSIDELASMFARIYLKITRPWYKRPRWHFWHWRFQIHPLQTFKRWAFSRCCGCKKRFAWGYSPIAHSWSGSGPRWFRGEKSVFHFECSNLEKSSCPKRNQQREP